MTTKSQPPIAVITGAGSGIGRATALKFAADGYDVRIFELSAEAAAETVDLIKQASGMGGMEIVDVSDTDSVRAAFAKLPRLDALVNNAGVAHVGTVVGTVPEDLDRLYRINVRGTYHCLHFGVQAMTASEGGSIVCGRSARRATSARRSIRARAI